MRRDRQVGLWTSCFWSSYSETRLSWPRILVEMIGPVAVVERLHPPRKLSSSRDGVDDELAGGIVDVAKRLGSGRTARRPVVEVFLRNGCNSEIGERGFSSS